MNTLDFGGIVSNYELEMTKDKPDRDWEQVGKKNASEFLAQLKSAGELNSSDDERKPAAKNVVKKMNQTF